MWLRSHYQGAIKLLAHRLEEVFVGLRILHLVEQEFHRIDSAHLHENAAQHPHLGQLVLLDLKLFLTRAGLANIERWEDPLVRNLAVEHNFGIACAFEFFKDHFIHPAAGINQRCRDD